jgi:hypothetical protein
MRPAPNSARKPPMRSASKMRGKASPRLDMAVVNEGEGGSSSSSSNSMVGDGLDGLDFFAGMSSPGVPLSAKVAKESWG